MVEMLVDSNFNAELDNPEGSARAEEIGAVLAVTGLYNTRDHFLLK